MSQPNSSFSTNIALGVLSRDDLELIRPHFGRVALPRQMVLFARDEPTEYVYFPENDIASIVSIMADGRRTEIGIFGRDGVSAMQLLLGTDSTLYETFMQIEGRSGLRIPTDRYLAAIDQSETLRTTLLRFVQTMLVQSARSTTINAQARMEARLARWLLMCHDRVEGDDIAVTHGFMGMMIAAERSGVTVTLHILEGAGAIWSKRGLVIIRDRAVLEGLASESYGAPEAEYRRLIGPFGRGHLAPRPS